MSKKVRVLGPHRRHQFEAMLHKLGHRLPPEKIDDLFRTFELRLAEITDQGFEPVPELFRLTYLSTSSGTGTIPTATVRLCIGGEKMAQEAAWGDGPIDATYNAIKKVVAKPVQLEDYASRSVTRGQDAVGEVMVKLSSNGHMAIGRGASKDLIEAGAKAFIDGLNRLAVLGAFKEEKAQAAK